MKIVFVFFSFALFSILTYGAPDSTKNKNPIALKFNIAKLMGNEFAVSIEIPVGTNISTELEISYFKGSANCLLSEFSRRALNATDFHHSGWAGMLELKKVRKFHRIINSTYGFALHYKDLSLPAQWLDFGRPFGGDGNEWDEINLSQQKKCYDLTFRAGSNFRLHIIHLDFYFGAGFRFAQIETSYFGYYKKEEKFDQYSYLVPDDKKLFKTTDQKFYPVFNLGMKLGLAFR